MMTPDHVLRGLSKDARPQTIRVVGCEPLSCDPEPPADCDEAPDLFTLSPPVRQAVDEAVDIVERLAAQILAAAADRGGLHA